MMNFFRKAQDPMSSFTHFIGAVLGVFYLITLQIISYFNQNDLTNHIILLIFGISVIALYSASAYYHYIQNDSKHKTLFRKLDHSMIYVLIAGSYTPIAMFYLNQTEGLIFTLAIWGIALFGIITKIIWLNAPRILYTLLYLIMGWAVVFYWKGFSLMPINCLILIALGGLLYTIGAIIYIIKKPILNELWGFHELFHIFILLGTFAHFVAIALFIA